MIGVLLKKQFLEFISSFSTRKNKKGETTTKVGIGTVGMLLLFLFCILSVMFAFFGISEMMAVTLLETGQPLTYFVIMTDMTLILGIIGSAMTAYAMLFQAKDTEFLMSLPIKPSAILISRSLIIYILSLVYVMIPWIPTCLQYCFTGDLPNFASLLVSLPMGILIAIFVGTISCILGGLIAMMMSHIKNKTFITVFATLVLLGGIYYFQFNSTAILTSLAENAGAILDAHHSILQFILWIGEGAMGDVLSILFFTALTGILFFVVVWVLARNFKKLSMNKVEQKAKKFTGKEIQISTPLKALIKKEFSHYLNSPAYILNSSLASFMMLLATAALIIFNGQIQELLTTPGVDSIRPYFALIYAGAAILLSGMNCLTAPSISLEGNNIWILQTSYIDPMDIFFSKIILHEALSAIPATILVITASVLFRIGFLTTLVILLLVNLVILLIAFFGLCLDVRSPKLSWTNETIPIKSNLSVLFSMFGAWGLLGAMAGSFFLIGTFLSTELFLMLWSVITLGLIYLCYAYLNKNGRKRFLFA